MTPKPPSARGTIEPVLAHSKNDVVVCEGMGTHCLSPPGQGSRRLRLRRRSAPRGRVHPPRVLPRTVLPFEPLNVSHRISHSASHVSLKDAARTTSWALSPFPLGVEPRDWPSHQGPGCRAVQPTPSQNLPRCVSDMALGGSTFSGMAPMPPPRCGIRELNATLLKQAGECNTTKSEQKALQ